MEAKVQFLVPVLSSGPHDIEEGLGIFFTILHKNLTAGQDGLLLRSLGDGDLSFSAEDAEHIVMKENAKGSKRQGLKA